jgi:hypothetical protein
MVSGKLLIQFVRPSILEQHIPVRLWRVYLLIVLALFAKDATAWLQIVSSRLAIAIAHTLRAWPRTNRQLAGTVIFADLPSFASQLLNALARPRRINSGLRH